MKDGDAKYLAELIAEYRAEYGIPQGMTVVELLEDLELTTE